MRSKNIHQTIGEWESIVGEQIRAARIASNLTQKRLAALAGVSVLTLSNLEQGKGSSLATVIAVVRSLGREDWLETLAPPITISPLHMWRAKEKSPRSRVRTPLNRDPTDLVR